MPEDTVIFDTENQFSWDSIARYYGEDDLLIARITEFDNGLVREEEFSNGIPSRTTERDLGENGGVRSWAELITYYEANGEMIARLTEYDNGINREELFEGGIRSRTTDTDVEDGNGGSAAWTTIQTYFDQAGDIAARLTTFDTGATREELYANGGRDRTTDTDVDDGNGGVHSWQDITTYYDANGQIAARVTNYDDGGNREELYQGGIRTQTVQMDVDNGDGGSHAWSQVATYFDANGGLLARVTTFDDGRVREDTYVNGVRVETLEQDDSAAGDAVNWSQIITQYQDGERISRATIFDNGLEREESFIDGIRSTTTEIDASLAGDARNYQEAVTTFNADGSTAQREVVFDNFVERTETYTNGVRNRTVETDIENTVNWQSRTTTYGDLGELVQRELLMDSGVETMIDYLGGTRLQRVDQDLEDNFNWAFRGTTYDDAGARDETYTGMDNGDETLDFYTDGARSARIEVDGNASHDWAARVTEYDTAGDVSSQITYDSLEELPSEYAGEFGLAMAGF